MKGGNPANFACNRSATPTTVVSHLFVEILTIRFRYCKKGSTLRWVVARSRFELLSRDPESRMIDRYTTGLLGSKMLFVNPN